MNRNIRTLSILALAIAGAAPAWATVICPDGTKPADHYNNDCHAAIRPLAPVIQGGSPVTNTADAKAAAAAAAAARSRSASRSTATGGKANQQQAQQQGQATEVGVEQAVTVGNSNDINLNVAVPAGGNSGSGSRTIIPAPIYAGPGVAPLPAGAMIQFFRPCGSLQMVIQRAVKGRETNTGRDSTEFDHTWTDVVLDATDGNGKPTPFWKDEDGTLWGTEYYVVSWTISTGIEGAFSAQVFGSRGGGGVGANAGIAIQVPVQRVIASMCKLPVAPVPPRTVFVEVPRKNGRK